MGSKIRCAVISFSKCLLLISCFFVYSISVAQEELKGDDTVIVIENNVVQSDPGGGGTFGEPGTLTDAPIDDFVLPLMILIIFVMFFFLKRYKYVEKS